MPNENAAADNWRFEAMLKFWFCTGLGTEEGVGVVARCRACFEVLTDKDYVPGSDSKIIPHVCRWDLGKVILSWVETPSSQERSSK